MYRANRNKAFLNISHQQKYRDQAKLRHKLIKNRLWVIIYSGCFSFEAWMWTYRECFPLLAPRCFMSVFDPIKSFFGRFRPFMTFLKSETVIKRTRMAWKVGQSEKLMLYIIKGLKRLHNQVHASKNTRITVYKR